MSSFMRRVLVAVLVICPMAMAVDNQTGRPTFDDGPTTTAKKCEEDQPCWRCDDMGNRICGPGAPEWMRSN